MLRSILLSALALPVTLVAQARVASTTAVPDGDGIRGVATAATAVHATAAPVLDGRGDDAVWATAPEIGGFRQFEPVEDGDPKYATTAK
ncbi:MAG TPA: hypothetical protein VNB89_09195, partial [Gemmatimonadaceae bacterium]|nr:hypothetical protein [Gemmatimonadaceae bacterium]